jgi:hypothetical protein
MIEKVRVDGVERTQALRFTGGQDAATWCGVQCFRDELMFLMSDNKVDDRSEERRDRQSVESREVGRRIVLRMHPITRRNVPTKAPRARDGKINTNGVDRRDAVQTERCRTRENTQHLSAFNRRPQNRSPKFRTLTVRISGEAINSAFVALKNPLPNHPLEPMAIDPKPRRLGRREKTFLTFGEFTERFQIVFPATF